MKTAKASILMFDLACPYCDGHCISPEGNGSLSFAINENAPFVAYCADCGKPSRVPAKVPGEPITRCALRDCVRKD